MIDPTARVVAETGRDPEEVIEALKERAAIREYLGESTRAEANRGAVDDAISLLGRRT